VLKNLLFLTFYIFFSTYGLIAQNSPVTTAPVKTACPGSVIAIPVSVTGFSNIGSISLTITYNPAVLTYVSASNTSGFPGMSFGHGIAGKVIIGGYSSSSAVNFPDNTTLFTITFNYLGGTTALTWFDNGGSCEYGDFPDYNALNDIPYSTYYINGQVGPAFGVDFAADNLYPSINQTVMLSDLTTGSSTGWNWSITPGTYAYVNGTTSGSQNPQVQFTSNGPYQVALAVTQNTCTITNTKANYIHSGTPGLWTGLTSSDWNAISNWHNYTVPGSTVDVVIPESSVNWPVYNGDLTVGAQCKSLKIEGTTSIMTVTGNLVLLPATP
jgi:PKD repeat protein